MFQHIWYGILAIAAIGFLAVVVFVGFGHSKTVPALSTTALAQPYDCPSKVHRDCDGGPSKSVKHR
jgi:hypothetical protein